MRGCRIASSDWVVGQDRLDENEETGDDISVDPSSGLVSLFNYHSSLSKAFFLTLAHPCLDRHGKLLPSVYEQERTISTIIAVVSSRSVLDLVHVEWDPATPFHLVSDIQEFMPVRIPLEISFAPVFRFPLRSEKGEYFLCSQSFGGELTHFFPETFFSIDFDCTIGTPVVAVGDGVVIQVNDSHSNSGVSISILFEWNSLMIQLDLGGFVEYVHINTGSSKVKPGDRVKAGDVICESGAIGFCPTPHLHIQYQLSADPTAVTAPFLMQFKHGETFIPKSGCFYSAIGSI